ncbi:MlaD family protein [Patulibacter sp. NPDC049589]|uniref:MlaD family protein n=1 Tax=Patulibacter sp. NPDC049589 TaxID=3154731 RepID=UPI003448AB44
MSRFRDRFAYVPGMHRQRPLRNGVILLALVVLVLWAGYSRSIPFLPKGGTEVQARFANATQVQGGTVVRVAGVDVGSVEKVQRERGRRGALVTMRIKDDQDIDLRADARASILWRTVLGRNMYIDLDPGTPGKPKLGGDGIPLARTGVQTEADQAMQPLGRTQRRSVQEAIAAFDAGTKDPKEIQAAIDAAGPALKNIRTGVGALRGSDPGNLTTLVRQTSRTMGALSASDDDLAGLVDDGRVALGVTAARRDDVGSLLDQAPSTMDDTRLTLARVRGTLDELDPTAKDLLPGARALPSAADAARPALASLDAVLDDAEPTLRSLRPAVSRLSTIVDPGITTIKALQPTVDRTNSTLLPWLNQKDPGTNLKLSEAIGPFFSALDSAASSFDANGFMMNFQTAPDERTFQTLPCTLRLTDPAASPENKINCDALGDLVRALSGAPLPPSGDYPDDPPRPDSRSIVRKGSDR